MSPGLPSDPSAAPTATAAMAPAGGPIARARARVHALLASHLSAGELFWALLVGAMVGATPFYGLHLALCLGLGWLLRLNTAAMYASANISIPPLIPFLGFACVQTGERLLRGAWLPLRLDDFRALAAGPGGVHALMGRFFVDWLAGGLVVGALIGAGIGGAVYRLARARRPAGEAAVAPATDEASRHGAGEAIARATDRGREAAFDKATGEASTSALASFDRQIAREIARAIAEASRRYQAAPRNLRYYAYFKYRLDPAYRRIAALVPPASRTVDLGTGLGMLPLALALLPGGRAALGLEWDAEKLAAGRQAAAGVAAVRLEEGDVRTAPIPPCDVVTLVDVLHYHPLPTQQAILARAAAALSPGGLLLVREGDGARRGGAAWTRWLEAVAVAIGWNRGDGATRFPRGEDLVRQLGELGLSASVEPLAGRLHPGNVLVIGRKPGETPPSPAASEWR